ncbi:MAG: biopolymer transporter ExbD [Zavarzinella sp.]|nr:biopolymer transporter ExbD [Zavarzinella sp.]
MPRKKKEEPPVEITLPITPMLDMSFQLLSFFILTFRPMPTEGQMSVALPKLDVTEQQTEVPPLPQEDKKDEYTITLRAASGGEIANISLRGPAGESPEIRNLNDLLAQLNAITPPAGKGKDFVSVTIEADNDLTYARLIEVMDLCRKAGYDSVNLMPTRKERS